MKRLIIVGIWLKGWVLWTLNFLVSERTYEPGSPRIPDRTLKGPCECINESTTYDECSYLISGVATGIVVIGNIAIGLKSSEKILINQIVVNKWFQKSCHRKIYPTLWLVTYSDVDYVTFDRKYHHSEGSTDPNRLLPEPEQIDKSRTKEIFGSIRTDRSHRPWIPDQSWFRFAQYWYSNSSYSCSIL